MTLPDGADGMRASIAAVVAVRWMWNRSRTAVLTLGRAGCCKSVPYQARGREVSIGTRPAREPDLASFRQKLNHQSGTGSNILIFRPSVS